MGRATQGVTLMALDEGAKLIGLQRIAENDAAGADAEGDGDGEADNGAAPDTTAEQ
jgi:DNA gyrase subunit A